MALGKGVCFGCGKEIAGAPAKEDWIIRCARKARSIFSLPAKHTVACSKCMPALVEKREKFGRNLVWHKAAAGLFAIAVLSAAGAQGLLGAHALIGAAAGAAIIIGLSLFSYCPEFENAK